MIHIDRYILGRLIILFIFHTLVLASIYWINIAVRLIENVLLNNAAIQLITIYFLYYFPKSMQSVMPVAAFSAATYLTYRLIVTHEITAIHAIGHGSLKLLRPYFIFAIFLIFVESTFVHAITPYSQKKIEVLNNHFFGSYSASQLRTGRFLFPKSGMAIFIEDKTDDGVFQNVFIHDSSNINFLRTIITESAHLLEDDGAYILVLIDGQVQDLNLDTLEMSRLDFDEITMEITPDTNNIQLQPEPLDTLDTYQLFKLLANDQSIPNRLSNIILEINDRITKSLDTSLMALIGATIVLSIGMQAQRKNFAVIIAIILTIACYLLGQNAKNFVEMHNIYWPLIHTTSIALTLVIIIFLMIPTHQIQKIHILDLTKLD